MSKQKKTDYVSCKILIKAPADTVWQTVHVERDSAPDLVSNKLLTSADNHSTFEQKWTVIPFLSRTTCVIDEVDHPQTRIDYKLLKSDEFKVMEGSWLFSQTEDGSATLLELTAHLEPRRINPRFFINNVARSKMARRLAHIKKLAEANRSELKVKAKVL
ncbi:MAG: SRPBCC family protein [Cyanobacteria bacterium REEB67]|nr:SRPBCC family protein [Cyanobacteria bacterium REEB67]